MPINIKILKKIAKKVKLFLKWVLTICNLYVMICI